MILSSEGKPSDKIEKCHCGKPLHYINKQTERIMKQFILEYGEYLPVTVQYKTGARTWEVQRHYIALHGLKAKDLPTLGFQEATE